MCACGWHDPITIEPAILIGARPELNMDSTYWMSGHPRHYGHLPRFEIEANIRRILTVLYQWFSTIPPQITYQSFTTNIMWLTLFNVSCSCLWMLIIANHRNNGHIAYEDNRNLGCNPKLKKVPAFVVLITVIYHDKFLIMTSTC